MLLCTYTVSQCIQMLAIKSDVCYLSYFHVHTAINILRCFGYPREHNFGLVLILSQTGCTEGCVYFPQSCRNTHLPHFLDCLLNTTLIPCLLVFFLSILHERFCDYSRVQSSVTGILRMGDMNIHITWLTHVRTGPPPKKSRPEAVRNCSYCLFHFVHSSGFRKLKGSGGCSRRFAMFLWHRCHHVAWRTGL